MADPIVAGDEEENGGDLDGERLLENIKQMIEMLDQLCACRDELAVKCRAFVLDTLNDDTSKVYTLQQFGEHREMANAVPFLKKRLEESMRLLHEVDVAKAVAHHKETKRLRDKAMDVNWKQDDQDYTQKIARAIVVTMMGITQAESEAEEQDCERRLYAK